jgi:hydrogenase-4 component E
VSESVSLLIGLAMGLNLLALASGRMPSLIRIVAAQGVALVSAGTVALKGFVIPNLLHRAMRAVKIDREIEPFIGFVPSLLLGAAGTIAAVVGARAVPLLPEHAGTLLVPGALASIFTGFILLIGRVKAISQVCGYLILENGIYLFGLLLIRSTPLLVESGILLDLTVAVFVIGIIMDRIQRAFDSLDTRRLTALRE